MGEAVNICHHNQIQNLPYSVTRLLLFLLFFMDKNDYNKRFTIGRIHLNIRRLIPPPPSTVWSVPHVTFLELRILKYFEVAARILESLWTPGYNFFFGAKFGFLMYSRNINMNCCYLAFVAELYADIMTLFWDFCFVLGCFFFIIISHGCPCVLVSIIAH